MTKQHFLVFCLPAQGHVNPTLQMAKNLARAGARATFVTTVHGLRRMNNLPSQEGLFYSSISDGYDDDWISNNHHNYLNDLKKVGPKNLKNLLQKFSSEGCPVTSLVYTILLPWVAEVARELHVPSAFLVIQCGTAFAIYHHLLNSTNGVYGSVSDFPVMPSFPIELPELPLFSCKDIPTIILPNDPSSSIMIPIMREHIQNIENDPNSCVLINTFDALEGKSIKVIDNMRIFSVGPLVPSFFSNGDNPNDTSFGCELFDKSENYFQWLDSKPKGSVVYVSFGSLAVLKQEQKDEILHGLLESERPFFWVMRKGKEDGENGNNKNEYDEDVLNEKGLIVPWCSQMEVLSHKSIGCFVTHCGWNSTLESIVSGVPIVGYPQFSDQTTNAKMIEEVWGIGLRAKAVEGIVAREELKNCLEMLMGSGEKGEEIKRNVKKWSELAVDATKKGGSSHDNLKKFLEGL